MVTAKEVFLLDANVFIEAYKRYYAFDICPGFWHCLLHNNKNDSLISIDEVKDEIEVGKDKLWQWVASTPASMFVSSKTKSVQNAYTEIMTWVTHRYSNDKAVEDFAQSADGWLVAYAVAHDAVVVTDEQPRPDARKRVLIPAVCDQFRVPFMGTFEMLRKLGAQFT